MLPLFKPGHSVGAVFGKLFFTIDWQKLLAALVVGESLCWSLELYTDSELDESRFHGSSILFIHTLVEHDMSHSSPPHISGGVIIAQKKDKLKIGILFGGGYAAFSRGNLFNLSCCVGDPSAIVPRETVVKQSNHKGLTISVNEVFVHPQNQALLRPRMIHSRIGTTKA